MVENTQSSGVLSVDVMQLELFLNGAGSADQQRWAEKLWPVVSCGHWFLASVSIMNSMANVALPLFLDQCVPPSPAKVHVRRGNRSHTQEDLTWECTFATSARTTERTTVGRRRADEGRLGARASGF